MTQSPDAPLLPTWLHACRVVLLAHVALAVCGWWMLPQGFPVSSPRFWVNFVLPVVVAVAGIAVLIAIQRKRFVLVQNALIAMAVGWTVLPLAVCWIFPVTGFRLVPRCAIAALIFWLVCGAAFRHSFQRSWNTWAAAGLAALVAILVPLAQAGPEPSTVMLFSSLPPLPEGERFVPSGAQTLDDRVVVFPHEGRSRCAAASRSSCSRC